MISIKHSQLKTQCIKKPSNQTPHSQMTPDGRLGDIIINLNILSRFLTLYISVVGIWITELMSAALPRLLSTFSAEAVAIARDTLQTMSISQQVAQRLIVGLTPSAQNTQSQWQQFAALGIGGFIFFGRDFQSFENKSSADLAGFLTEIRQGFGPDAPFPFLSIDQEGGLVEHLPAHVFPTLVSPMAVGKRLDYNYANDDKKPNEYAAEVYDLMAVYLNMLGFNTNFAPVLDVHGCEANPVIGIRAFSSCPERVIECGNIVKERFEARGLMAVGKHAPGHGYSALDSHDIKPTLPIMPHEQQTFKWAVEANLPALMVAHATYPDWQGNEPLPASLSKTVVTNTLRNQWGYGGILISDDMHMGGVTEGRLPEDAAILACQAGLDMLIYRYGGDIETRVHQSLCKAIESGTLSREEHEASVLRILLQKQSMSAAKAFPDVEKVQKIMTLPAIESVSQYVVESGVVIERYDDEAFPLLDPEDCVGLILPDWETIPIYQHAARQHPNLVTQLEEKGIYPVWTLNYPMGKTRPDTLTWPDEVSSPDVVVWVTYRPHDADYQPDIETALETWLTNNPECRVIIVEANLPGKINPNTDTPSPITEKIVAHIQLFGFRYAHQARLVTLITE